MDPNVLMALVFVLVGLLFGAGVLFMNMFGSRQQLLRRRLERFKEKFSPAAADAIGARPRLARDQGTQIDKMLREILPRPAELKIRLAKTGRDISLTQYSSTSGAIGFGAFLFFTFATSLPVLLALLLGTVFAIAGPHFYVERLINQRIERFIGLFPEAIDLIVRGLRSGLPVNESMNIVGREIEDPVGIEFRSIGDSLRLGKTLDEALWDAAGRVDTPDFKFFVISLAVQKETGGNLAETLNNLGDILRKRHQMKLKVRALSSEGRASAYIVGSLPFIMFGILLLLNYDYASILFTDDRAIKVVSAAMVWMMLGVLTMGKMINFEI